MDTISPIPINPANSPCPPVDSGGAQHLVPRDSLLSTNVVLMCKCNMRKVYVWKAKK